ncbi:MAG TPA: energy transducer TonB [Proteobacteria bacterium]|nr:energy transducer TonB [Pseudomonadota bacterium]
MSCDHRRKRDLPLALFWALVMNLLIMALMPWLFRRADLETALPQISSEPIFIQPARLEANRPRASSPPKALPQVKPLPPLLEKINPPLAPPAINPRIKLDAIKIETRIDQDFKLQPLPVVPAATPEFYRFDEVDRQPLSTARMEPIYPFLARRRGIEGSVKIRFLVTRQGLVEGLEIIAAEPPGYFEKAVQETVANWRFEPGLVNGAKVRTMVETTIVFKLGR